MKDRPILFNAAMVRAILDGNKTQTRRVVKPQPMMVTNNTTAPWVGPPGALKLGLEQIGKGCPYGQPGDRLWVRETWHKRTIALPKSRIDEGEPYTDYLYRADAYEGSPILSACLHEKLTQPPNYYHDRWFPSIHMPRAASRITLEITGVRLERLNEISEEDARAEGITDGGCLNCGNSENDCGCLNPRPDARDSFIHLWQSINGEGSWLSNPWVWVVEFKRLEGGAA